jgi:hypothetical protein
LITAAKRRLVEPRGFKPLTFSLRRLRHHPYSYENNHYSRSVASFVAKRKILTARLPRGDIIIVVGIFQVLSRLPKLPRFSFFKVNLG